MTPSSLRIPVDEDLSWFLLQSEAVLGRTTAFREGGTGSSDADYERRITDARFSFAHDHDKQVGRARRLGARFSALRAAHRDVLAMAYGLPQAVLRSQVLAAASPQTWFAMERAFGDLAGVALLLTGTDGDVEADPDANASDPEDALDTVPPPLSGPPALGPLRPSWRPLPPTGTRKVRLAGDIGGPGGAWRSPAGLSLLGLCLRGKRSELAPVQAGASRALGLALAAWWHVEVAA